MYSVWIERFGFSVLVRPSRGKLLTASEALRFLRDIVEEKLLPGLFFF